MKNFMKEALIEAKKALKNGDIPIGAVIVENNKIISRGFNKKELKRISTRHAEIEAIEKACKKKQSWHLENCTLFVTVEPCLMCAGAIIQSRIGKLVYSIPNSKFGFVESIDSVLENNKNNHFVIVEKGICYDESQKLMVDFFKDKRK